MSAVCASARKTRARRGTIAVMMNTYKSGPLVILPALAATVVLLLGSAAVVSVVGWQPGSTAAMARGLIVEPSVEMSAQAAPAPEAALPRQAADSARSRRPCGQCGVITSIREVAATGEEAGAGGMRYEFTVRQEDSTHRVITDVNPAAWRVGERVIAIGGAAPSSR